MPPEKIRQLPLGQALVIYRSAPAMLVDLPPWTRRPDGADIAAGIDRIRAIRSRRPTDPARPVTAAVQAPGAALWTGK